MIYLNNINDVLSCRRVMEYKGVTIEYVTDIDGVKVNPYDMMTLMQHVFRDFGHIQTIDDLAYLLSKHKCLPRYLATFELRLVADYMHENMVSLSVFTKLGKACKAKEFETFLKSARDTINKYGVYLPDPTMKHYDRRKNNERNLADTLDLKALEHGSYRLGLYTDNAYIAVADAVTRIVFNRDLEDLRCQLGMLYDDYVSDYVSDYDFDTIAYCCKVMSYLLKYSDISIDGLEILTKMALDVAESEYSGNKYQTDFNKSTGDMIGNIFDTFTTNDLEYNENQRVTKKNAISKSEVDDLKKYL